jgi:hypothetical protein
MLHHLRHLLASWLIQDQLDAILARTNEGVLKALHEADLTSLLPLAVRRLDLKPGDRVLISCRDPMTPEQCNALCNNFATVMPGVNGILLSPGMDVSVVAGAAVASTESRAVN